MLPWTKRRLERAEEFGQQLLLEAIAKNESEAEQSERAWQAAAVAESQRAQPTSPEAPSERPYDLVQSASHALRVLEVVTHFPGLPVKAIARRSGLNLSTTYHVVRTLAYRGYVTRLKDGTYDVGEQVNDRFYEQLGSLRVEREAELHRDADVGQEPGRGQGRTPL